MRHQEPTEYVLGRTAGGKHIAILPDGTTVTAGTRAAAASGALAILHGATTDDLWKIIGGNVNTPCVKVHDPKPFAATDRFNKVM